MKKHKNYKGVLCYLKTQHGMTMVELMVVMLILILGSAMAVPAFISWQPRYKLKSAASDLSSALQRARVFAVQNKADISVRFVDVNTYYIDIDDDGNFNNDDIRTDLTRYGHGVAFMAVGTDVTYSPRGTTGDAQTLSLSNRNAEQYDVVIRSGGGVRVVEP